MHSFWYRANALLTFAVTILALMCAMASLSDNLNSPSPTAQIQILNINWFQKQPHGNDEVSLWDAIIPTKEQAKFWVQTANKYRFVDQGSNLRGKQFNLTLHWHVMPKTGKMFADKLVMSGYHLPEAYR
ncbi:hypothetical protein JCGZ_27130 [Jatropha curcas]|uniref:Signal peptidase complex subunit 3 n=1 Tax=Jatropha curcas TaxID=180498 RepID=A0A067JIQ3_JATCU|nr:hypothetical protein JCGZ_27130 [Jatropha curcas]